MLTCAIYADVITFHRPGFAELGGVAAGSPVIPPAPPTPSAALGTSAGGAPAGTAAPPIPSTPLAAGNSYLATAGLPAGLSNHADAGNDVASAGLGLGLGVAGVGVDVQAGAGMVEDRSRVAELAGWARAATGKFSTDHLSSFVGWGRGGTSSVSATIIPPGTPAGVIPATPLRSNSALDVSSAGGVGGGVGGVGGVGGHAMTEDPPTSPYSPIGSGSVSGGSETGTPASQRFVALSGASPEDGRRSTSFSWQQRPGSAGFGGGGGISGRLHSLYQGHLSPLLRISRSGTPSTPKADVAAAAIPLDIATPLHRSAGSVVRTPLSVSVSARGTEPLASVGTPLIGVRDAGGAGAGAE